MLLKKPYEHYIYDDLVEMNPSWLQSMKDTVSAHIQKIREAVKKEAEKEGDEELLDTDNLYSRFKFNKEHDMKVGNIRLLKYFVANLVIKVYRESIGFWEYTEEDREMYDYFHNGNIKFGRLSMDKYVIFKNKDLILSLPIEFTREFVLYAELDIKSANNIVEINYFDFFSKRSVSVLDLINKVRNINLIYGDFDLFKNMTDFRSITIDQISSKIKGLYTKRPASNYEKTVDCVDYSPYRKFLAILNSELKNNTEYLGAKDRLLKVISPILEEVIKQNYELYDNISDLDKVKIQKLGSYIVR